MMNSCPHLVGVRAIVVSGVVDIGIVEGDEMRSKLRRQLQPRDHLMHALFIVKLFVEVQVIRRPFALNLGLGARPEEARRPHSLLLCQHPQRRTAIPTAITVGLRLRVDIRLFARGVPEAIRHDAVVLRIETSDDADVIGKRKRRVSRKHTLRSARTLESKLQKMGSAISSWIVVAEAIERDQDNIVLRLLSRSVRRIWHRDDWRWILRETQTCGQNSGQQPTSSNNKGAPHLHSAYSALSSISSICRHNGRSSMQSIRATDTSARSIVEVRHGRGVSTRGSRCCG